MINKLVDYIATIKVQAWNTLKKQIISKKSHSRKLTRAALSSFIFSCSSLFEAVDVGVTDVGVRLALTIFGRSVRSTDSLAGATLMALPWAWRTWRFSRWVVLPSGGKSASMDEWRIMPRARVRLTSWDAILYVGVTLPLGIIVQLHVFTELVSNVLSFTDIFCSEMKAIRLKICKVINIPQHQHFS